MRIDRREFLWGAASTGCALAFGLKFFHFSDDPAAYAAEVEQLVRSTCSPNCTGACGYNARITNGRISTLIQ
ncbi:MAG: twin-arginine translocation signal domain-containing protein, partial [Desulfobulbaceae bacterium]